MTTTSNHEAVRGHFPCENLATSREKPREIAWLNEIILHIARSRRSLPPSRFKFYYFAAKILIISSDYQHNLYGGFPRASHQNNNNNRPRIKPRILPNNKPPHQGSSATRHSGPLVPKHVIEPQAKSQSGVNEDYIKFLSSVTNDILKSGNFTMQSIKRVLEQHLEHNKV